MKKKLLEQEKKIETEIKVLHEVEYGLKEFLHGLLLGIIVGLIIAWIILT